MEPETTTISKRSLSKLLNYAQGPVKLPDDHFAAVEAKKALGKPDLRDQKPVWEILNQPKCNCGVKSPDGRDHQFGCPVRESVMGKGK